MKKLILLLLLVPSILFAQEHQAKMSLGVVGSAVPSAGVVTNCISGTYVLGWNGDWTADTDKACIGSGDTTGDDADTIVGGGFSTSYGESGSVGWIIDGTNDFFCYNTTTRQYAKDNVPQTVWMRIYISAALDDAPYVMRLSDSAAGTERLILYVTKTGSDVYMVGTYVGVASYTGYVATGSWITVGWSWDKGVTDLVSSCYGTTWGTGVDISGAAMTTGINRIYAGNYGGASPGSGKYVYVDKWVIQDGYKTACPW